MLKVAINGYTGRMGSVLCNFIEKEDDCQVVAGISKTKRKGQNKFETFESIFDCNIFCDVIIDFSNYETIDSLIEYAKIKKLPVVICTTALKESTIQKIKQYSEFIPIFKSSNMSIGINLILNILENFSKILHQENFDIEILEKHHNHKIDAPSGTAYTLAETINNSVGNTLEYIYDRSSDFNKKNHDEIGIYSLRGGSIVGDHSVVFAGKGEVIELNHITYSKEIFVAGAIKAAKFIALKKPGLYDMKDLLGDNK